MISGVSATSFNWAVFHKNDVIASMADNEYSCSIGKDMKRNLKTLYTAPPVK